MAPPSKGTRNAYRVRVPAEIDVEAIARIRGCSSVSQFLADVICQETGRPDLVREIEGTLPMTA
jgi:hypothetical protein